jgi:hypothetical protein
MIFQYLSMPALANSKHRIDFAQGCLTSSALKNPDRQATYRNSAGGRLDFSRPA